MSHRSEKEPAWLTKSQVRMLHAESLRQFGGSPGVRDEGLVESALARPQHLWIYDEPATLFDLSAAYSFGLTKNHGFVDGNKRVGVLAIRAFLFRNGYLFSPDEAEMVMMMEGVAGGSVSQEVLSEWIEDNSQKRK